MKGTRV